jgi:hypothetical protein
MRDTKSLTLLLVSSVLFLLSIILLCTWGYQYYNQIQQDKIKVATAPTVPDGTRDSLLKIYKSTLSSLDTRVDTTWYVADSLQNNLSVSLKEFYKLRDEIGVLLQSQAPKLEDLNLARKKIAELQYKVEQLRYRNTDVETENKRLQAIIKRLSKENNSDISDVRTQSGVATPAGKSKGAGQISAVNLSLAALTSNANEETRDADNTNKLVGSFTIKNNTDADRCDIVVVVMQPDGRVMQKSDWESGTFTTKAGKKIYSCKVVCNVPSGESRQLNFSLLSDYYQKGNYVMQLYHNGVLVGSMSKLLS